MKTIREPFLTQHNSDDGLPLAFVHWNGEHWRAMEVRPGSTARLILESRNRKHADEAAERVAREKPSNCLLTATERMQPGLLG